MPDRYTYPNSEVLKNKFNIVEQFGLDRVEQGLVELGLADLSVRPEDPTFTFAHLKAIHRRLFGELYTWAGMNRETDRGTRGPGAVHCRPEFIESMADEVFGALKAETFLAGLEHADFAARLAVNWGALARLDPFRDGNIRSQAVFLDQLARRAGWRLDWAALDPDWAREARMAAATGNPGLLARLLSPAVTRPPE